MLKDYLSESPSTKYEVLLLFIIHLWFWKIIKREDNYVCRWYLNSKYGDKYRTAKNNYSYQHKWSNPI